MPRRNTLAFKSGRVTWPPIRTSQSHLRSLVRTFSTLALDHATQLFNPDLSFLVSMLQLTGCPLQTFSRTSAVLCNQSHSQLSLFPALCRHCHHYRYPPRSTEPIPLVHHVVLRISSLRRCPTLHVRTKSTIHVGPSLSSRIHAVIYFISVIQVILSLSSCRCSFSSSSTSTRVGQ